MGAVQVQHYLGRAKDFLKGMESLLREEIYILEDDMVRFSHSPALLGIHGAISYCDALRVGLGSENLSSDDHKSAARELRSLLASYHYERREGVDQLDGLLARKSAVAYSDKRIPEKDIHAIVKQARRFSIWAEAAGKDLKIEGWHDA